MPAALPLLRGEDLEARRPPAGQDRLDELLPLQRSCLLLDPGPDASAGEVAVTLASFGHVEEARHSLDRCLEDRRLLSLSLLARYVAVDPEVAPGLLDTTCQLLGAVPRHGAGVPAALQAAAAVLGFSDPAGADRLRSESAPVPPVRAALSRPAPMLVDGGFDAGAAANFLQQCRALLLGQDV